MARRPPSFVAAALVRRASACAAAVLLVGLAGCTATVPTTPASSSSSPQPGTTGIALPASVSRLPRAPAVATGSPTARVLVRATLPNTQQGLLVQLMDAEQCRQPHLLGLAARSGATPLALTLPAGRPVTLDFIVVDSSRLVCGLRWSFTPQADRQYLVQGTAVGSLCPATLTDVTQADRPRTPEDLRYRMESGKPCVPLDQARRVPPSLLEGGQVDGEAVLRPLATEEDLKGLITR